MCACVGILLRACEAYGPCWMVSSITRSWAHMWRGCMHAHSRLAMHVAALDTHPLRTCLSNAAHSSCPSFIANASAVMPCCGGECMRDGVSITEHKQRFRPNHSHRSWPLSETVAYPYPRQTRLVHRTNSKAEHGANIDKVVL